MAIEQDGSIPDISQENGRVFFRFFRQDQGLGKIRRSCGITAGITGAARDCQALIGKAKIFRTTKGQSADDGGHGACGQDPAVSGVKNKEHIVIDSRDRFSVLAEQGLPVVDISVIPGRGCEGRERCLLQCFPSQIPFGIIKLEGFSGRRCNAAQDTAVIQDPVGPAGAVEHAFCQQICESQGFRIDQGKRAAHIGDRIADRYITAAGRDRNDLYKTVVIIGHVLCF